MNKVCLVGRLVKDPELRSTESGMKCVSTFIAINNGKDKEGNERPADFPKIIVYDTQAENLAKYQKKGNLLGIEGRVKTHSWEDKDGNKKNETYVAVDKVEFLNSKSSESAPIPESDYVPSSEKKTTTQTLDETVKENDPFQEFANEIVLTDKDLPF